MSVRAMQARVRRLEQVRRTMSPFVVAFGSFAAFETHCNQQMKGGLFDPRDFPVIIMCLRAWEEQGIWGTWLRDRNCERGLSIMAA